MDPNKSSADGIGLGRVAGWVRRSCRAVLADLELADCGSLEVLLYCSDDLAVGFDGPSRVIDRVGDG